MSKFLKFIVHFVVICTIACILGLALPPFFGVRTVIMDTTDKATNLPYGSVTYAIPVKTEEVTAGTPILVEEDSKTYKYSLMSVNRENNTGTVVDTSTSAQQNITVSVKNWVPKVVITLPLVGYLLIATQSIEGLIILGLVLLFLIILYVIAELWKKEPEDDYEYEDGRGDRRRVKTSKELKAEEKAREKRMKQEDKELLRGAKEKKKNKKEEKRKKIRTGGFVDEIYEDDLEEEVPVKKRPVKNVQTATSEAHELLKKEIAAATADDEPEMNQEYQEPAESTYVYEEEPEEDEIEEEKAPVEIKKLAIPKRTASQLANKARKAGDAPDVVRDSITKVTLFDYSDIIGGDEEAEEE
ncbi:hypothetical protein [Blautia sp. MSJ-19]|uniref:hypothetical protein n=1 Tax=Blautia sp. MSJ-19 TaxID=2841517 RepID=UPI001C0F0E3E|nr:hypothetical protein [Blautia sp. MSJ-19]MBU5481207.1 hypothetical protein [Blautia sp. MSJ-19]